METPYLVAFFSGLILGITHKEAIMNLFTSIKQNMEVEHKTTQTTILRLPTPSPSPPITPSPSIAGELILPSPLPEQEQEPEWKTISPSVEETVELGYIGMGNWLFN